MSVCFCVQDVEEAIVTLIEGAEWEEALRLVSTVHTLEVKKCGLGGELDGCLMLKAQSALKVVSV